MVTVSGRTGFPNGLDVGGAGVAEGAVMHGTLRVASNVAESETVVIGADVWEVSVLDDDTTDNTAAGDFNNTTAPYLTVTGWLTKYPNSPSAIGRLIRVENEIMEIVASYDSGQTKQLKRGVSGTAVAAHANALDIFADANHVTAGRKATGLNAALTPTAFLDALVHDINNRGNSYVKATKISANEMFLESAERPGGAVAASDQALATTETLAGTNNAWGAATMGDGRLYTKVGFAQHTVTATDVALDHVRIPFPFTVLGFQAEVYDANGLFLEGLTDQYVISGNAVILDGTGVTNPAAGQFVRVIAWGA